LGERFVGLLGVARVHVDADAAAIDLAGTQVDQVDGAVRHIRLHVESASRPG
jgi:hypothetical protein